MQEARGSIPLCSTMIQVDNTFEQHLRKVLPDLNEDKIKLVMALQDKCHAKVLEARGQPIEKVSEVINDVIREIRGVLGEQQFRQLFGDFETLRLIDPSHGGGVKRNAVTR